MLTTQNKPAHHQNLNLGFGFSFNDFYERDGLVSVDAAFLDFLGGTNALISAEQSVSGMRAMIVKLTPADSGRFFAYDGKEIPW